MIVNAGKTIDFNIAIRDKNDIPVYDDTPKAIIKSLNKNKYFNGLFFVDEESEVILPHVGNGEYSFLMFLDSVDEIEVLIKSDKYNITKSYHVVVVPEVCEKYCKPGEEFTFFINKPQTLNMLVYLVTDKDGKYYVLDTNTWSDMRTFNMFTPVSDNTYKMSLNLEEGVYSVSVLENTNECLTYTLNVTDNKPVGEVVMVSSNTLLCSDGSPSNTVSEQGGPVQGVKVTAIDVISKKPVAMTTTNDKGDWHFMIERGKYLFTFERQGYTTSSLIKEV